MFAKSFSFIRCNTPRTRIVNPIYWIYEGFPMKWKTRPINSAPMLRDTLATTSIFEATEFVFLVLIVISFNGSAGNEGLVLSTSLSHFGASQCPLRYGVATHHTSLNYFPMYYIRCLVGIERQHYNIRRDVCHSDIDQLGVHPSVGSTLMPLARSS